MEFEEQENFNFFGSLYNEILPPNEHKIGGLYLGKIDLTFKTQKLSDLGIGAVLSIIDYKFAFDASKNVKHLFIQAEDDEDQDIKDYFKVSYEFIHDNLKKTNVYVHCQMGISRSSSLVIAYLMKEKGLGYNDTLNFVRSKRNCVCPNEGFEEQLKQLEIELKEQKKNAAKNHQNQH